MTAELAEAELWKRYHHEGDPVAREALYQHHSAWAKSLARSVHRRVWAYPVDSDDFVQNATIGLLEAMSRYNPDRGIPFRAYATPRVRGAVFNGLRAIIGDRGTPRTEGRLGSRLAHLPAAGEDLLSGFVDVVADLGMGLLADAAGNVAEKKDGLAYAQDRQLEQVVRVAVDGLPPRLRTIIREHYFERIPFTEIASRWGVSKGRLSQLHHLALNKLRSRVRDLR